MEDQLGVPGVVALGKVPTSIGTRKSTGSRVELIWVDGKSKHPILRYVLQLT